MRCDRIIKIIEDWAPKPIAWDRDNVGLQIGSLQRQVKNVLLCLEVNQRVVSEAIKKKCNLIISHHPLLFHPIKKLDITSNEQSRIIEQLIKNNITLYSAHTNLDFAKNGVSFQLAKKLKLSNQKFLHNLSSNQSKIAVFVPVTHADKVAEAIHNAGAGVIGEYSNCSFRTSGKGTFKGSDKSNPNVGRKNKLEMVDEIKIEVLTDSFNLNRVINALKLAHPYEEVAYDIYPLSNENVNYGMGVIGELTDAMTESQFLNFVSKSIGTKNFRFTHGKQSKIKKVALCGGSGSDLLEKAIGSSADAFITADIKYHTFQEAESKILLIDAGHYETEIPVLDEIKKRIEKSLDNKTKVFKYSGTTNPIVFYNNKGAI